MRAAVTAADPGRSATMRAVKSRDTGPERQVRSLLHQLGYRFGLHAGDLPGRPDIVFRARRAVVFVHGCFWHGHDCARGARTPKTNRDYWLGKIGRNRARDARTVTASAALGWTVVIVWECEIRDEAALAARLGLALGPPRRRE